MLRKLQQIREDKKEGGFTIIEVLIVLAIAALILVIVLVAIPQLQRNQRNTNRRAVLSRIATEVNNFAGNNNGTLPVALVASADANFGTPNTAAGFFNRYLGCNAGNCTANIQNPSTGTSYTPVAANVQNAPAAPAYPTTDAGENPTNNNEIGYYTGAVCAGENVTTANAGGRNFALVIALEGGARYCLDNR